MSEVQSTKSTDKCRVEVICPICQKSFFTWQSEISRGGGIYCNAVCFQKSRYRPQEERFWAMVEKTDSCWLWTGAKHEFGHGIFVTDENLHRVAHRISWTFQNGPIPEGLCVLHNCPGGDNPSCVNPTHLFLGTLTDNTQDMIKKGRSKFYGTAAKLTSDKVVEIRARYAVGDITKKQLATEYRIHPSMVDHIISRRRWKHC